MRAEELTRQLGGHWHGHYGTARCPAHDDGNPSLSIADGEARRLLLYCHAGCAYQAVRVAIAAQLGSFGETTRDDIVVHSKAKSPRTLTPLIARLWSEAIPVPDTHAASYLAHRAIRGQASQSLRFHASLRPPTGARLPTMLARVDHLKTDEIGLHRTFLDAHQPTKTKRSPDKAMLGPCNGGAVRLRTGGSVLVVCEGIETGLSLCDALDESHSVWAALSAPGVAALALPDVPPASRRLILAIDADAAGRRAAAALGDRAHSVGWRVEIASPPDGKEFNDIAVEAAHG